MAISCNDDTCKNNQNGECKGEIWKVSFEKKDKSMAAYVNCGYIAKQEG
jgi:hypothetical protein